MIETALALVLLQTAAGDSDLPTFEVATVRPIDTTKRNFITANVYPGGRMSLTSMRLGGLAAAAWMLPNYRVEGPKGFEVGAYTIEAQPPEDDSLAPVLVDAFHKRLPEVSLLRLRALLLERFKLRYHFEMREVTAYDLVVGKSGHKMRKVPLNDQMRLGCFKTKIESEGRPMWELARDLADFYLNTEVVDKTGLTDAYTYSFSFQPVESTPDPDAEALPSLRDGIKDIGLALVPRRSKARFLVIDYFEKPASN